MSNAAGFEIIFNNGSPPVCFDTLAEAEQFANWRREPCKIWAYGPNDGYNNWQKIVVIYS